MALQRLPAGYAVVASEDSSGRDPVTCTRHAYGWHNRPLFSLARRHTTAAHQHHDLLFNLVRRSSALIGQDRGVNHIHDQQERTASDSVS